MTIPRHDSDHGSYKGDSLSQKDKILGLIAGGGQFPLLVADSARTMGYEVVAVAHYGETEPDLEKRVDKIKWIRLGQFGQLLRTLKQSGARQAIMAGSITKRKMFENIQPDLKGLAVMTKLAIFHDDDILRIVAKELEREGIKVISSTHCLPDLLAPPGCLTRRRPTRNEMKDIRVGWRVAKAIGRLDLGQCVVVRRKTVVAVEAIEGTDETILRGGALAKEGAVVVKVSKPHQDMRFDVPAVGLRTLETMARVKAKVLAIEAARTLMFDKDKMLGYANQNSIAIYSTTEEEIGH